MTNIGNIPGVNPALTNLGQEPAATPAAGTAANVPVDGFDLSGQGHRACFGRPGHSSHRP